MLVVMLFGVVVEVDVCGVLEVRKRSFWGILIARDR
jgi:hypothetical protein